MTTQPDPRPSLSRRRFLQASAASATLAGAAAASTQSPFAPGAHAQTPPAPTATTSRPRPRLTPRDAVVIGSGFGGSVAALRLAEAGVPTTVFERGRRWNTDGVAPGEPEPFPHLMHPDGRAAWFNPTPHINQLTRWVPIARFPGLIDRVLGGPAGVDAVMGAGVGGGSLVFGTFLPQARRQEWERVFPTTIPYTEMDSRWYPLAKRELGGAPFPEDLFNHPTFKAARAWRDTLAEAGMPLVMHDFAINWDRVREELDGRRAPSVIVGDYVYGTNSGAKQTLDRSYLARAEATGRVTVRDLTRVVRVEELADAAPVTDTPSSQPTPRFRVHAERIDESGAVVERMSVDTDLLVMAAGSVWTSALLGHWRDTGALPKLSPRVGDFFGTNGDYIVAQTFQRRDFGAPQAGPGIGLTFGETEYGPYSMSWEAAPFPPITGGRVTTNLVQVLTPTRGHVGFDAASNRPTITYPHSSPIPTGSAQSALAGSSSPGAPAPALPQPASSAVGSLDAGSSFGRAVGAGAVGSVAADSSSASTEVRGAAAAADFQRRANAQGYPVAGLPVATPLGDLGSGATWHPLGGVSMDGAVAHGGADAAADSQGRVHGYDNILIADGSLLPGAAGLVNPALTITAIAERSLHHLLNG